MYAVHYPVPEQLGTGAGFGYVETTTSPPNCLAASSNVSLVRKDGFSKSKLTYFPTQFPREISRPRFYFASQVQQRMQ